MDKGLQRKKIQISKFKFQNYTNITYDGTMYLTGKMYRYSGEYSYTYASNYVSHSYNDGTLTITSTNANIGCFYNTSYKLVYFY